MMRLRLFGGDKSKIEASVRGRCPQDRAGTCVQLVIEKPIRDALGLGPGHLSVQRLVDDHVEIRFFPPEHDESLRGVLAPLVHRKLPPERWDEVRAAAWTKASGEVPPEDEG